MPTINQLPLLSQVSSGDQIPVYSPNNGDSRRLPVSALLDYFEQNFTSPAPETLFYTPVDGFNIPITTTSLNVWLLIQPASALTNGTIVLPPAASVPDGQIISCNIAQTMSSLSFQLNGAVALVAFNNPVSLPSGGVFKFRFFRQTMTWYRTI